MVRATQPVAGGMCGLEQAASGFVGAGVGAVVGAIAGLWALRAGGTHHPRSIRRRR